jgi:hypothetical protein
MLEMCVSKMSSWDDAKFLTLALLNHSRSSGISLFKWMRSNRPQLLGAWEDEFIFKVGQLTV